MQDFTGGDGFSPGQRDTNARDESFVGTRGPVAPPQFKYNEIIRRLLYTDKNETHYALCYNKYFQTNTTGWRHTQKLHHLILFPAAQTFSLAYNVY